MSRILNKLQALVREEDGLTTVEYAIAGGLVGLAVVAAFILLGEQVGAVIGAITTAITPAATPAP
jgi:pilus assembly protein Flp/PilA